MKHRPPPTPLYQRVFGVLYQRIRSGDYPVGQALDTEDQLAAEFSVSKATIRKAVDELVARGLVVRRQGRGTFVREEAVREIDNVFVGSLIDLISGTPKMPILDTAVERGVRFPNSVRADLGSGQESGTVVRNRRTTGGTVFVYSVHYLSPAIEPFADDPRLRTEGLTSVLYSSDVVLKGAEQSVSAQLADTEVGEQLDIGLGAPVLFSKRVLYSTDGPIDVVHSWYRGDLYEWRAHVDIDGDGHVSLGLTEG